MTPKVFNYIYGKLSMPMISLFCNYIHTGSSARLCLPRFVNGRELKTDPGVKVLESRS